MRTTPFEAALHKGFWLLVSLCLLVTGCRWTGPNLMDAHISPVMEAGPLRVDYAIAGSVQAGARATQATVVSVGTACTVSLIDPTTNRTVSSTLTDGSGAFRLTFPSGFVPDPGTVYVLEASKGLSTNLPGNFAVRLRTIVLYDVPSQTWLSLTTSGTVINASTTALCVGTALRQGTAMTVSYTSLLGSVTPGSPDVYAPVANLSQTDFHTLVALVDKKLADNSDPIAGIGLDVAASQWVSLNQSLSVTAISPASGTIDTPVTMYGTGFSSTPASNSIFFNGVAATVTAMGSTATGVQTLATAVPPGALSGPVTVQVGNLIAIGPSFGIQGYVDTTGTQLGAGTLNGLAATSSDPIDGGDGAVTLAVKPLKVLQIYPSGHNQTATAQGVYNWRPDLFDFELLPTATFNTLGTLDEAFLATKITKSTTTAPASASVEGTIVRRLRDYDLLLFGIADSYAGLDLTATSRDLTRAFANLGRGVVFTHSTVQGSHALFLSLSDIHGLGTSSATPSWGSIAYQAPGVNTTSPLLKQPFDMSTVSNFSIQPSHSESQTTSLGATSWYAFDVASASTTPYWTTYTTAQSHSAFLGFGHTEAVPSEYEAKAMINSMYYTYDRGNMVTGSFTSRALDSGTNGFNWEGTALNWTASLPNGNTTIAFQVGAGNNPYTISTYVGPDGTASSYFTAPAALPSLLTGRYLRYRAILRTNSLLSVPVLSRVDLGDTLGDPSSIAITPTL